MKNHLKDYEKFKQSNPLKFLVVLKNQLKKVKTNLDHYFKIIYNNYIKSLVIHFNLLFIYYEIAYVEI